MPLSLVGRIWLLCIGLGAIFFFFRTTRKFSYFLHSRFERTRCRFLFPDNRDLLSVSSFCGANPSWVAGGPAVNATYDIAPLCGTQAGGFIAFLLTRRLVAKLSLWG